jgi:crotonobetainyl-CoA:carnitine CoA-transferase CaiB-like acyl-CoA transferase
VLDLTRVIAGPVATRDLAAAGADVLRVDSPRLPEIAAQHLDTGQGKRSTLLDLDAAGDRQRLAVLLDAADVVVTGYRPGALGRFGLDPEALAERRPGLVVGQVSAWGTVGPWAGRRGFDSIVQATIGIAVAESPGGGTPGALPAQALDHSAGHLLAAGIALVLARQRSDGGSHRVSVALARVGQELLATPGSTPAKGPGDLPTVTVRTDVGQTITCAPPVLAFAGAPNAYPSVHPWGSDEPRWLDA